MFKFHRGLETEGAVESLAVIKDFDVFEDGGPCLREVGVEVLMDEFGFKGTPKRFHVGVVIAVAGGAHAGKDLVGLEQGLEGATGILETPIGVVEQSDDGMAKSQGLF